MFRTNARLEADLARWQQLGWVTAEGAAEIRREWATRGTGFGLYGALAVLGAILLGLAAMSFVAAHWDQMSKLARLALLVGAIAASYATAFQLFHRRLDSFAHAAVLVGVIVYGAAIMLIAQMYHMDGNPPDAVWLWSIGALAAGWLLRSNPALAAGVVMIAAWSGMEVSNNWQQIHWPFLPMWAVAAGGIAVTRWVRGMHLLALALSAWIVMSCLQFENQSGRYVLTIIGLALAVTATFGGHVVDRWRRISGTMLVHGMGLSFIGLFAIQFLPYGFGSKTSAYLWLWGGLTIALLIAAMTAGWRTSNGRVLWLSYAAFSVEVFALYVAKIGSLLGTSAFFLVTGILVIALAALAYRMREATAAPIGVRS